MATNQREPLVLVIDELSPVVRLIEMELRTQGVRTQGLLINQDPVGFAGAHTPDAIVLGTMVPTPNMYEVLGQLKQHARVPILFINSTGGDADAALALEMGADDVIARPFNPVDLSLRLRALLHAQPPEQSVIQKGPLEIDAARRMVWKDGAEVNLGTTEWTLFLPLVTSEEPVSPDLLAEAWGLEGQTGGDSLLDWINRLRAKLGDNPDNPDILLGDLDRGFHLAP